jgi:hypothetical protein
MAKIVVNGELVDEEEIKPKPADDEEVKPKDEGGDLPPDDDPDASNDTKHSVDDPDDDSDQPPMEAWMASEDDADAGPPESSIMPVSAHIRYKRKQKEKEAEREAELEQLRKENEALRRSVGPTEKTPERPKRADFATEDEYYESLEKYEDELTALRLKRLEYQKTQETRQKRVKEEAEKAVEAHYERAAKIVKETGIKPEVYQETDRRVREAVDAVMPKLGDVVVDQAINVMGEGSEKVLYFLGRNQAALDRFKSLLAEDSTGMKAMIFLGQQKERLTGSPKIRSKAPTPAPNVGRGGTGPNDTANARALKKAYKTAHDKGDAQAAYEAKKKARQSGLDVSAW